MHAQYEQGCYKRGYFRAWLVAYDDILAALPSVHTAISQDELDRIDAWVENDLTAWVNSNEPGEPPVLSQEHSK